MLLSAGAALAALPGCLVVHDVQPAKQVAPETEQQIESYGTSCTNSAPLAITGQTAATELTLDQMIDGTSGTYRLRRVRLFAYGIDGNGNRSSFTGGVDVLGAGTETPHFYESVSCSDLQGGSAALSLIQGIPDLIDTSAGEFKRIVNLSFDVQSSGNKLSANTQSADSSADIADWLNQLQSGSAAVHYRIYSIAGKAQGASQVELRLQLSDPSRTGTQDIYITAVYSR